MADATIVKASHNGRALSGKTLPEIRKAYAEAKLPEDEIWAVAVTYSDGITVRPFRFSYEEYSE